MAFEKYPFSLPFTGSQKPKGILSSSQVGKASSSPTPLACLNHGSRRFWPAEAAPPPSYAGHCTFPPPPPAIGPLPAAAPSRSPLSADRPVARCLHPSPPHAVLPHTLPTTTLRPQRSSAMAPSSAESNRSRRRRGSFSTAAGSRGIGRPGRCITTSSFNTALTLNQRRRTLP